VGTCERAHVGTWANYALRNTHYAPMPALDDPPPHATDRAARRSTARFHPDERDCCIVTRGVRRMVERRPQ